MFSRNALVTVTKNVSRAKSEILSIGGKQNTLHSVSRSFTSNNRSNSELKIGVQSAPFAHGQLKPGVDQGPEAIRSTGFIHQLQGVGVDIKDYGAIDFSQVDKTLGHILQGEVKLANHAQVGQANKIISDSTSRIVKDGRLCLTLGGDHSIGIGTISGVQEVHEDLAVLWVDAHADINIPSTTWSGKFHGMASGFLIKELESHLLKIEQFSWLKPKLQAKNLAFIGLRDVDDYEREIIESLGILAFSMKEVSSLGIQNCVELALEKICPGGKRPLHMSFDIDALDDLEAQSTGTPVPGGLTLREGLTLVEQVRQAGNLVSMDLVEVNPLIGSQLDVDRTTLAAKQILLNTFGYYRGGIATKRLPKP